ncbi:MAG: LysM peptidoglycan-binding domain-containing protein [Anaerolineales bacterium]|nr:LysM peptidoglycan-binding domain-containing protein [Anaerolineales bacterium]
MQTPFFIRALGLAFIILLLAGFQAVFGGQAVAPVVEDRPVRVPALDTGLFTYTVQEGDTLRSIAKISQVEVETIMALNDLGANAILRVGQTLLLPYEPQLYRLDTLPVNVPADVETTKGMQ